MTRTTKAGVKLLTAEEYGRLPNTGLKTELIRGRVVILPGPSVASVNLSERGGDVNVPYPRHGQIAFRVGYLLQRFLDTHPFGQVVTNDSGVVTAREPDTVRGADVAYFSATRVPLGPLPAGRYLDVVPEIVIEVFSTFDRSPQVMDNVAEYLRAGVSVVCVADQRRECVIVNTAEGQVTLSGENLLTFPELLPGFSVAVRRVFE